MHAINDGWFVHMIWSRPLRLAPTLGHHMPGLRAREKRLKTSSSLLSTGSGLNPRHRGGRGFLRENKSLGKNKEQGVVQCILSKANKNKKHKEGRTCPDSSKHPSNSEEPTKTREDLNTRGRGLDRA